jgi:hypothetical protein
MKYALSREQALGMLREYAAGQEMIRFSVVEQALMEPMPTDAQVAHAYRIAAGMKLLPRDMALDPRMAQLLAMDT